MVKPNGTDLITLSDFPDVLGGFFDLDRPIPKSHPPVWWHRSRNNLDIAVPMPKPSMRVGRSPVWEQAAIIHWYAAWKGLNVPMCREAGDRLTSRGSYRPSPHRRG